MGSSKGSALVAEGLAAGWNGRAVISNVSLRLRAGGSLAIIGESGCGKTTLLSALAGIEKPLAGTISWEGGDPVKGMVWQSLALMPWKRAEDNLMLPLLLSGVPKAQARERARAMLSDLELKGRERAFPHELSGGQRQRLALGRALIANPGALFMDEPFSALDAMLRERMQDELKRLVARQGCTLVFVTHDIAEAAYLGEEIMMLGARPTRVAAIAGNPAFESDPEKAAQSRSSQASFEVQRRLRQALRDLREGRGMELEGGGLW
jgi:ABC-type nitrate/sulfonate/bicarbonate transport system ATPase subunit